MDQNEARLGINTGTNQDWDGSTSHKVDIKGKCHDYGTPPEGSRTEERAKLAGQRINDEIVTLVSIIRNIGTKDEHGHYCVPFGRLFTYYEKVSNKVVGILLRARRWNLVSFTGEMLFQGRDDDIIIKLLADEEIVPRKAVINCKLSLGSN